MADLYEEIPAYPKTYTDALSHVGQVVSYRRAAGNPIDPSV